jgi:acyl-coenzyme A thioesterase PaaI-like protein
MKFTTRNINRFLFFKLPSAWWAGVRLISISTSTAKVTVKHKWFNQNPFKSIYFAVQAMAAELSTGVLVMHQIQKSGKKISMLVAENNATFTKKATGKITFVCEQGFVVEEGIAKAMFTGEGETFWVKSIGYDEKGDVVSQFNFKWTVKVKK